MNQYTKPSSGDILNYWSPGRVSYTRDVAGHLEPVPVRNSKRIWVDPFGGSGFYAPQDNADVGFRRITDHQVSNYIVGGTQNNPQLHAVGFFDPDRLRGFSALSSVPLTTYYPPDAAPGDARTARLLGGRSLLPNANLGGYLQQPPLMLTTLKSLPVFTSTRNYTTINGRTGLAQFSHPGKPISVIRVRVAGVTGPDEVSRERVRVVAEQITRDTGLDVDVTIGSSPTQQLIDLPAGTHGRPPLTLSEGWTLKGVTVRLLSAIDRKSLALFGLVLLVCLLFLVNATLAALRSRRTELGVLSCLGWPRRRIFALLEAEVAALGLVAGLVGTGIAMLVVTGLGLHTSWAQLGLVTPVATLLAVAAGLGPAVSACRTTPLESIHPAIRAPRRAARVTTVRRLALVGIARWPGRTLLAAASLFIGVAALAALIAINDSFHGQVTGTALGDVVAIQVRTVDYLAAAITLALGGFAIADIAYLNINERATEIGTLSSTGWTTAHLRRLFATEALTTVALGATAGAAAGVGATAALLPISLQPAILGAAAATAAGLAVAALALLAPLANINRLNPAATLTTE
ncbi:MAG: FtsX-like permease family protein [Nocardioidaceae bacterium]